jgi:lipoprotein-releasing system ATP-binding protein
MPLLIRRMPRNEAHTAAAAILTEVGLGARLEHMPGELSGGERQRAALARALVTSPACVLADEPTGNLDRQTGEQMHNLLRRLNQSRGITVLVVTHNDRLAGACDRTLRLEGGALLPA